MIGCNGSKFFYLHLLTLILGVARGCVEGFDVVGSDDGGMYLDPVFDQTGGYLTLSYEWLSDRCFQLVPVLGTAAIDHGGAYCVACLDGSPNGGVSGVEVDGYIYQSILCVVSWCCECGIEYAVEIIV